MKIVIIPVNDGNCGCVELVGDTLFVWAEYSPCKYDWRIESNGINHCEIEYLQACLAIDMWLTRFEPTRPVSRAIFNV